MILPLLVIQDSRNPCFLKHLGQLRGSFTIKRFGRIWLNNGRFNNGRFNNGRLDNGRTCVWNDADIYGLCIRFICLALTRKLVETRGGSLEGIGSIFTLKSVSRMATRTTRYSFLLWTKKLTPLYLIWAYHYWQREGLTFCSVNNIATNVSLKLSSRTS